MQRAGGLLYVDYNNSISKRQQSLRGARSLSFMSDYQIMCVLCMAVHDLCSLLYTVDYITFPGASAPVEPGNEASLRAHDTNFPTWPHPPTRVLRAPPPIYNDFLFIIAYFTFFMQHPVTVNRTNQIHHLAFLT